jgi:hypothetical protein
MGKWGGRAAFAAVVLALLWAAWRSTQVDRAETRRRVGDLDAALAEASKELLQGELPGLTLDLSFQRAITVRSRVKRYAEGDREGLKTWVEPMDKGKSALYFFAAETGGVGRLQRVQIASNVKGLEAVVARVQAREARLGPPSGVYDCPAVPGQVPTRRYTFKRGTASAMEVYALVGEQTAITYYVASTTQIRDSLKEAQCAPTPPERAARFPVAVP